MKWKLKGKKLWCIPCDRRMLKMRGTEGGSAVRCPECGQVVRIGKRSENIKEPRWTRKLPPGKGHGR